MRPYSECVDLRSDTVTRPVSGMRAAMAAADVGDDVFGDDPSVNALQSQLAAQFGFAAGLFFPSGTQANLAALMSHCQRGDEFIVGQEAHTYRYEGGGAAVLGSIQPQPIANAPDGSLDLAAIESAIKPDDAHFAITRLLALENTIGGKVLSTQYTQAATRLAQSRGLRTHLDGARIFNASTALNQPVNVLCAGFDSVSVCLSKGLGTPAGSVLLGDEQFIHRARRLRKMLGGGMRQAGVLAAAGLYALSHHVERLAEDHANAAHLAAALDALPGVRVEPVQTNMVFVHVPAEQCHALAAHLAEVGVLILPGARLRLVTHLDIDRHGIDRAIDGFRGFFC